MSRAFDVDLVQKSNSQQIFKDIADVLCRQSEERLEIEFLGKSHPLPDGTTLLVDGNNVAIPKGNLVLAFLYARRLFFEELRPCPVERYEDLYRTTAVILLMDPEHLSAANARKRLLKDLHAVEQKPIAIRRELVFVDGYLTSRLHRHTKSPTLWSHRRWLLTLFRDNRMERDLINTVHVVLIAAERHPRNYYAWLHLRWVIEEVNLSDADKNMIFDIAEEWSLRNPSDTSGFSFLYFCIDRLTQHQGRHQSKSMPEKTMNMVEAYGWTNESVWVFLRTLTAVCNSREQAAKFESINHQLCEVNRKNPRAVRTLYAALEWQHQNKQN